MAGSIQIVKSDIKDLTTECIVNAANESLREGGGVCGAIFEAAGKEQLQAACDQIGGCEVGSAVITPGFNMAARYIIHAVGPHWYGGSAGEKEKLYSCYQAAMRLVRERGRHSVGFPLISAGIFKYPEEEAWDVAIRSIRDFFAGDPEFDIQVIFAVRDDEKLKRGNRILRSIMAETEPVSHTDREDDFGAWLAMQHGHVQKRFRIYTADQGRYKDPAEYRFIAEFADEKLVNSYIYYMKTKKRYSHKDLIIREVVSKKTADGREEIRLGKIVAAISAIGEFLPVEEIDCDLF